MVLGGVPCKRVLWKLRLLWLALGGASHWFMRGCQERLLEGWVAAKGCLRAE